LIAVAIVVLAFVVVMCVFSNIVTIGEPSCFCGLSFAAADACSKDSICIGVLEPAYCSKTFPTPSMNLCDGVYGKRNCACVVDLCESMFECGEDGICSGVAMTTAATGSAPVGVDHRCLCRPKNKKSCC
jgi:hypothetical protein